VPAKENPDFVHKTQREWAKQIGCSDGLITYLPFWQEVTEKTGRKRKGKQPRVVSLTDKLLATKGNLDKELERLISEQAADQEQSPLEGNVHGPRPKRARCRKKL